MDLDLRRLRVFLVVAEVQHFGRAAERLRMAQPSVSQQVARLETQLGTLLFLRGPRGVSLTDSGIRLMRQMGPAVRNLDAVLEDFMSTVPPTGRLRVGVLSSMATFLVPAAVPAADLGGLEVSLAEAALSTLVQRLKDDELDVVFCYSTDDESLFASVTRQELDDRPTRVALPASDPLAGARLVSWLDAAARRWVMPSASGQYYDDMLARFARRGHAIQVVAEATTLAGQLGLVAAGIGWTFTSPWATVPPGVTNAELQDGDRLVLLALTRDANPRAAVAALIASVRDRARALP